MRLFIFGAELQAVGIMEFMTSVNGTPAVETSIKHSGNAALRINNTGTGENFVHQYRTTQGPHWIRTYFHIVTGPASDRQFISIMNSSNVKISFRMRSGADARKLQLYNEEDGVQLGSDSSALSTGVFYRLELYIDDTTLSNTTVEAKLYAASDAATLLWNPLVTGVDITASPNRYRIGTNSGDANFDVIYDDCGVNDNTTSFNNSWLGEENLVALRPDGNNGTSQWSRGGADSGNNYSQVDETLPNDATDYVESNTNNQLDEYTLEATPSAIQSSDIITGVFPSSRFETSSTTGADPDFVLRIKYGSDFDETANISGAGSTIWTTHQTAVPQNYLPLPNDSNYQLPNTSTAYTKATVDNLIVGIRQTFTDTHFIRVTAVWVYVGYKPSGGGGSPVTIALDVAAITAAGIMSDVIPGTVSKLLDVAALISNGRATDVIPGVMNKLLDTAVLNITGRSILFHGVNTIILDVAAINSNGRSIAVIKGAISKLLDTALMQSNGNDISFAMGLKNTSIDTAAITIVPYDTIINVGTHSVSLDTATVTINGRQINVFIVSGIMLDTAMINATSPDIVLDMGEVIKLLDTSLITSNAYSTDIIPHIRLLPLDTSSLLSNGRFIDIVTGTYSVPIDTANLFSAGQDVSLVLGARSIDLDTSFLQALGNSILIEINEQLIVLLDTAQLSTNGKNITINVGTAIISLSTATLLSNSPDVIISAILSIVKSWTLSPRSLEFTIEERSTDVTLQYRDNNLTLSEDDR